jgi:glycosyltransferase involved in cell wall biosynthesis
MKNEIRDEIIEYKTVSSDSAVEKGFDKPSAIGLTVVIPAFNEKEGIVDVVENLKKTLALLQFDSEIIVVDDGSTDGTEGIIRQIEGIRVVTHQRNLGYGAALKTGLREASYDWMCITDADGTYPHERIPDLVAAMEENDMVIGARLGAVAKIPLIRRPAKWFLNQIANYLAKQKIPDLNSGFRIFDKKAAIKFLNILPNGFSFTTTITLSMLSNNYRVHFLPIKYNTRIGKSKIRPIHDTINFFQLIIRTILYFDPLRIFLPIGFVLISAASILFILRLIKGGGFAITIPMFVLAGIQVLAIGMLADLMDKRM